MKEEKRAWLVHTSTDVSWFVMASNAREAMLKVLFWSDTTEAAIAVEAL